jgi:hypothetical protein
MKFGELNYPEKIQLRDTRSINLEKELCLFLS